MNITIERCSVCSRPPCNRIVYRKGTLLVCGRLCAKESIGITAWNEFFETEARHRLEQITRHQPKVVLKVAK